MTGGLEKCVYAVGYLMKLCLHYSLEISIFFGLISFYIVGLGYFIFAIILRAFLAGVDMAIGSWKAEYIKHNFDSRIFGRALFKRTILLVMGLIITVIVRHLASALDDSLMKLVIALLPIGYFHLASLQEFKSILEQRNDIDPNNWMAKQLYKISSGIQSKASEQIDKRLKQFSAWFYDNLSPNNGKKYLNRTTRTK